MNVTRASRTRLLAAAVEAVAAVHERATGRVIVGVAGPPGVGKSTLAAALTTAVARDLAAPAVTVPMDGFHLSNAELRRLGLADRKGAPETFDAAGFVALLRRLRNADRHEVVYAPMYSRIMHESVGSAIPVPPSTQVVIVEGNYLLVRQEPWTAVRGLLDLALYLDASEGARRGALLRRQRDRGLDPEAARDWVDRSDEANARVVAATRNFADLILRRSS